MLDQEQFLKEYNLEQTFKKSGMEWKRLEAIYEDYKEKNYPLLQKISCRLVADFNQKKANLRNERRGWGEDIHVIYGRAKEPEHVIEKIIRKVGNEDSQKYQNIDVCSYKDILKDLIGIRVIVIKKEGWKHTIWFVHFLIDFTMILPRRMCAMEIERYLKRIV